ncbi:T9SS type B sorting domain-containing protein [uncultured Winogradskyella sp.]|uniref:T9SS type B sorting domain-containing protein n=1 Tax=uncultured Winogradskyella sp. TaxID=395353 RepID=UPI0025DE6902|nr:T9SS type B sorting domain-containing protein [uncultured Winogradskyella sp.]
MSKKILLLTVFIFSVQVYSQDLLMQDGTFNQCMGTFLDSGGGSAGYSNNENFTITICPDIPGEAISINFTAFNTENPFDFLSIFDGTDDTAAPLGTFTGINSPGLVEPSDANTSGCLTFVWTSDNSIPLAGWSADISCFTPCQNIIANVDSTVPGSTSANVVVADVNDSITFNGSGTFTTGGIGATYLWDFGDGNTGLGESVNHTYTTAGFYVVTLTITDTDGCTSTNNIGLTAQIGTTSPGNPSVDAGDDIDIPCTETCTTLTASFLDIGETNTYTVTDIAFVPPFPFDGLTNNVNTNIDDAWDDVEDLPFDFCFFDNVETQFQVGSNGLIRFDVDPDDTSNYWNLQNDTLPNESNDALGEGNVFTPVHDIDPRASTGEEIAWEIIGTAPNRVLAVSFYNVQMWQCNGAIATHMAVFYETTNVIDIYIKDAPYCDRWNNNKAVGIQNDAGTQAFVPPGRNTNEGGTFTQPGWTAQDEAWRFTPAGPSIVEFAWLDDMGNVLSTDASFEVCPTDASTTYTAQVTYTNCNGDITIVTDDVTVTTNSPFTVDLGPDVNQCEGDADVNLDATTAGATTYQWSLDGVDLVGETNPTLTVISPNSGNYLVTVTDATGCIDTDAVLINYAPIPDPSFTVTPTCDGGTVTITGDTGGTFTFNPIPTDGAVIDTATGEVTGGTSATTYTIEYTTAGACPDTSTQDVTVLTSEDSSFTVTPTCDGGTVVITGDPGGTFTFNPIPTDGAVIDTATGEVTGGISATTYTIEYTLLNICSSTSAVTFMVNPLPNDAGIPSDFLECENNTDFKFDFDLETKNSEILNGQDQTMFTVTYHDSQADADNLVDPLVSPYENISNPQLIFVAITNNMTGCSVSSQSFNIEVLNGASAFDDFYEECDVVNDNDGFTQFDLDSRSPIIMNGADPFAFSISYYFSFDDAVNDINPLPFLYENLTNPQIIYARVSNNIRPEDCFEISELTLQTNLLPIFDLDDTYTLCLTSNNEAVVSIPLVIDTELSDANYSFEWRFNGNILTTETDSSLIPTQSGTYSVLVTDTSTSTVTMCTNFDETVVVEGGIPDTFDIEVVSEIFIGNNVIIATVTGNSEYEFSLDNGPWQLSGEFENVSCGDHTVAVRDVLGCGILFKDITLIDYPKFFTPNGDGNNDTWTIKGIDSQPSAVIYIYNRFGKLLKQLSPTGPGWDGTYNGKKMPSSDYWFTLEYTEPINDEKRTFSAHFALKR